MHLPWSESELDEFQLPDGDWYYSFRAIVLDSWLLWRDALPEERSLRSLMDQNVHDNIVSLARKIHLLHQSLPEYRTLFHSPFHVTKWWDPREEDPDWSSGRSCLLRLDGYEASTLINIAEKRSGLSMRAASQHFVEFQVRDDDPALVVTRQEPEGFEPLQMQLELPGLQTPPS